MIELAPILPVPVLIALAGAAGVMLLLVALRDTRHLPLRAFAVLILAFALLEPVRLTEERAATDDIGLILVDGSASMTIGDRQRQADTAIAGLEADTDGIRWQIVRTAAEPDAPTRMGAALEQTLGDVNTDRLGAVVVITDGISDDAVAEGALPADVPLHLLIAGDPDLIDRRLVVESTPPFTVVGDTARLTVRIDGSEGGPLPLTVRSSEGDVRTIAIPTGIAARVDVPVTRRGPLDVALSIPTADREVTAINNRALVRLNGVQDRLSVLLVSGVPYPGGRLWRDLFKADANVDLVHFTILRLPSSFDPTSPDRLALIPFPVEELFQERLGDFDLIIFDRFELTRLMSPTYFENLAAHVRDGGGLLVVAGDELNAPDGLARTALASVLPARPLPDTDTGIPFRPGLSALGTRHPVTRPFRDQAASWGQWGHQIGLASDGGSVLMEGRGAKPLLILDRVGDGRVGMIGSTDIWWWARAVAGAGPRDELLRRTAHWLMQEPELDEVTLTASGRGRALNVTSRGVEPVSTVEIQGPDERRRVLPMTPDDDGSSLTLTDIPEGLYTVAGGDRTRFAIVGNAAEFADVRPRRDPLAATAEASGGLVRFLKDGIPGVRRVSVGANATAGGDVGVRRRDAGALLAIERTPLVPAWLLMGLAAFVLTLGWWRERG